jgi:hypothetical protein
MGHRRPRPVGQIFGLLKDMSAGLLTESASGGRRGLSCKIETGKALVVAGLQSAMGVMAKVHARATCCYTKTSLEMVESTGLNRDGATSAF